MVGLPSAMLEAARLRVRSGWLRRSLKWAANQMMMSAVRRMVVEKTRIMLARMRG